MAGQWRTFLEAAAAGLRHAGELFPPLLRAQHVSAAVHVPQRQERDTAGAAGGRQATAERRVRPSARRRVAAAPRTDGSGYRQIHREPSARRTGGCGDYRRQRYRYHAPESRKPGCQQGVE